VLSYQPDILLASNYKNYMKTILACTGVAIIGVLAYVYLYLPTSVPVPETVAVTAVADTTTTPSIEKTVVSPGQYNVIPKRSSVSWAGQKPLISGYTNDGSIALQSGSITVKEGSASGSFVIDMTTLSTTNTPTKPGQETKLDEHLKSDRWFDVAAFPTATFKINSVTLRPDSGTTFVYDITGSLTMKGQTHPLTFPATISQDGAGTLTTTASLEFDRTLWGITAGSASFFDNLADNAVDNLVALSFSLVAEVQ